MNANFVPSKEMSGAVDIPPAAALEYIVFQLGERKYGIDLQRIQCIRSYQSLTRIASGSDFLESVAISDGSIMPLVDMRLAVSIEQPSFDIFTVVIVLKILNHGKIGLVVDGVMDVVNLADHDVYPIAARESHPALAPDCVTGVATYQGRSLMLLDLQKLFHDTIFEKIGETRGDRATSHAFRFQGVSTRSGQALLAS